MCRILHSMKVKPRMLLQRSLMVGAAVLVLFLSGILGFHFIDQLQNNSARSSQTLPKSNETKPVRISLAAAGDMLAHETVTVNAKRPDGSYDYVQFFQEVTPILKDADIRFCNHEVPAAGEQFGISGYPVFNAPKQFTKDLVAAGCNVFNIANNHINDKHQAGIDATIANMKAIPGLLAAAGANRNEAEQKQVRYFTVEGIKVAFLAFSEISNDRDLTPYGLNMFSDTLATPLLAEAKQHADVVMVSMHWGTEYSAEINAVQHTWAQKLNEQGADIILGTGPHVLQPVEKLRSSNGHETLVWYSLGNMLSTQESIDALVGGFAFVDITKNGSSIALSRPRFLPTYMHYEWSTEDRQAGRLTSRSQLMIYPLDAASGPLGRSLHATSVEAQFSRVEQLLNKYTQVDIVNTKDLKKNF